MEYSVGLQSVWMVTVSPIVDIHYHLRWIIETMLFPTENREAYRMIASLILGLGILSICGFVLAWGSDVAKQNRIQQIEEIVLIRLRSDAPVDFNSVAKHFKYELNRAEFEKASTNAMNRFLNGVKP